MAATSGTYTLAQGSDTTASALYTLWKNTIAPGMGFDNATELFYDQASARLVYTKTNLVGTYATTYWQFYFTNNVGSQVLTSVCKLLVWRHRLLFFVPPSVFLCELLKKNYV